ncbi:hypothetical protein [Vibrio metschnikovii]|uniref:Uncharacterized protein n=1 Tax=Vibrio metschnikovii TaxID=28172 RepID=A0A9X0R9E3_VIBME|nr:hypothetical protein [Vibrio metschnikovii]MBC5852133.1 hypothetical protein [Vibrio metschnikovii]
MSRVKLTVDTVDMVHVEIDRIDAGVFDNIDGGKYSWFPRRTEQLSGNQIIEIGKALNEYNKQQNQPI